MLCILRFVAVVFIVIIASSVCSFTNTILFVFVSFLWYDVRGFSLKSVQGKEIDYLENSIEKPSEQMSQFGFVLQLIVTY